MGENDVRQDEKWNIGDLKADSYGLNLMGRHDDKTNVPIFEKMVESAWRSRILKMLAFLFV